jgi:hypothetical protein
VPSAIRGIQIKVTLLNKRTAAMALYPFILINRRKELSPVMLNHERIHLMQQLEMLIIPFYVLYLIELVCKGYRNISFEREAYVNEKDADYLKRRKLFSWLRYYRPYNDKK